MIAFGAKKMFVVTDFISKMTLYCTVLEWCPQVPAGQTSLAPYEPGRICSTKFFRCYDDGTAYLQVSVRSLLVSI